MPRAYNQSAKALIDNLPVSDPATDDDDDDDDDEDDDSQTLETQSRSSHTQLYSFFDSPLPRRCRGSSRPRHHACQRQPHPVQLSLQNAAFRYARQDSDHLIHV